jgi:predicted DNA-binding protein with PD1-like motif
VKRRVLAEGALRTIVAVFDIGDEIIAGLTDLVRAEEVTAASPTAVGAVREATLGELGLSLIDR